MCLLSSIAHESLLYTVGPTRHLFDSISLLVPTSLAVKMANPVPQSAGNDVTLPYHASEVDGKIRIVETDRSFLFRRGHPFEVRTA